MTTGGSPHSAIRADQHHPTVVAPPSTSTSISQQQQSNMTKSPSKARSFFRGHGHGHSSSTEAAHLNTSIPSPSLHMNTTGSQSRGLNQQEEDDAALLHIRLKQEAEERAMRTSPRSSAVTGSPRTRHTSNLSGGGSAPTSYGYDGRDVYPSSSASPTSAAAGGQGHNRHERSSSLLAGGGGQSSSSIAPSGGGNTSPTSGGGAGGGINAGWYMTTGVLPAVIQTPPPGQGAQDNLSRSGSLGQRSRLTKYGSLFDATGLERSGTQRTGGTGLSDGVSSSSNMHPSHQQQHGKGTQSNEGISSTYANAQRDQQQGLSGGSVSPDYVQNVSGLRSKLLDDTADATAANRSLPPFGAGKDHHHQQQPHQPRSNISSGGGGAGVSAIPVPMGANALPDAVTNAAQTAQHRRNISRDGTGTSATSPARAQHQSLPGQQAPSASSAPLLQDQQQTQGQTHLPIAAMHSREAQQGAGQGTNNDVNQGRFQEEMSMVGRKSEDTPRGSTIGMLPAALANTGPSRGDSLKDKTRGADATKLPSSTQGGGLSSYNRGELHPQTAAPAGQQSVGQGGILPAEMGEALPASEIARQRELQNAYATQGAREEPRVAASAVGITDPPQSQAANTGSTSLNNFQGQGQGQSRALPRQEVVNTATQGPSYQTTRVSEPKVVSQQTQSYLEHPLPNISFPAPNHPHINELFGNIAQPIPHYMFVNYTASVCQECVASERKMYALTHGGEKWRYTYADPKEEQEIPSDDVNTSKTGREEFKDEVSLLSSSSGGVGGTSSYNKDGKGPCKCEECLKNREIVKYAAENGLIEKIFEGRRHPASELIETITTTTIVRAPIIRETITTIWCEEPNCMECAVKQKEYDEAQRLNGLEKAMNGMVIHETGGDHYTEYKNLLNVNGARGPASGVEGGSFSSNTMTSDSKSGLDRLLKLAGNPRQEKMRRMPGTTAEFDGHIVGFDDDELVGRSIEEVQPSDADVADFVKSGTESRM